MLKWILLDIAIGMSCFMINKVNSTGGNTIEELNKLDDAIQDIEDEETKQVIENLASDFTNNPVKGILIIMLIYLIPIFNIYILIDGMKEWYNNAK